MVCALPTPLIIDVDTGIGSVKYDRVTKIYRRVNFIHEMSSTFLARFTFL